jgi:hypothetical protein
MQSRITAHFSSVDEADRAAARLRAAIPYLRAEIRSRRRSGIPAHAPFSASAYYPWRINMTVNEGGSMASALGSRVLYTSDLMGLPIYHDGDTELLLTMDAADLDRAKALLINLGAGGIRILAPEAP